MLSKVTSIFSILEIIGKKENKIQVLKKSKILSLQVIDWVFYLNSLNNNKNIIKVKIKNIISYFNVYYINIFKI